jgi:ATP-dependent helicase/nuclease subunit A
MDNRQLLDKEAREKIKTALDTTLLVEAGAGSGKTHSLVDRMLALLASGRARINTFAAVTFTRKAAAELRGRFQTELERAVLAARDKDKETHDRLAEALHYLEQSFIGTIHSFCAKILRERPIEIALDPDFAELEDIENSIFRENCWHEYLVKARLEDEEGLAGLEKAGVTPVELKDSFISLSLYPEVELVGGSDEEPDYGAYRSALEDFLGMARERVPSLRPEKGYDELQYLMDRCFLRQANLDFRDHGVLMETLELLDKNACVTQNRWPSKEEALGFKSAFDSFRDEVVKEALRQWREYSHSKILAFLKPALDFFRERRLSHSKLNFQDQLMLASELLRENPEVRRYFSRRYSHILVDEFQDTDPIQAEVLLYLAGTNREEKDWHRLVPRPGSLFLVGDPKQSIFRFRRADIDTYNLVKEQIKEGGGEVLHLTTNFRSLDELAVWNNGVFKNEFPKEADRYQAAFAPMNTVRDGDDRLHGVYKISIPKQERNKTELIVDIDSEKIADFISSALGDGADGGNGNGWAPSDFMILFRYKKNMTVYARALEKRGIPYEITGSSAFSESEEAREILNLVRALNDPDNPIYTVAVLRGIFFGVSDEELYKHKQKGGRFSFSTKEDEKEEEYGDADEGEYENKGEAEDRVVRGLAKLRHWWGRIRDYPATTALEIIFEDSGIVNYAASSEMGSSRAGNLFKLLTILRSQEREGTASFAELVDYLEELVSVYEIEEMSLTPGRKNAVRLMNLHKAKGLEASFVFLANPVGIKGHEPDKHIIREGMIPEGYFLCRKKVGQFHWATLSHPVGWEEKAEEEMQYDEAEEQRLIYVASTRAKDCLVVSTYEGALGGRHAWSSLDDYIQGVPELEIPDMRAVEEREKLELKKDEWEKAKEEIKQRRDVVAVPSYAVESVTSLAKKDLEMPEWRRGSYGMAWGRAVHKMLEIVGKWDGDWDGDSNGEGQADKSREGSTDRYLQKLIQLAENVLVAEEISLDKRVELVKLVLSITRSEFWERVKQAERKLFEVPFSILTDREVLPTILTGAIDLAFLESEGWIIADFKTDDVGDNLQGFVDYYAPQVKIYCRYWAEITKQPIKEAGLYFTSIDKWVEIKLS